MLKDKNCQIRHIYQDGPQDRSSYIVIWKQRSSTMKNLFFHRQKMSALHILTFSHSTRSHTDTDTVVANLSIAFLDLYLDRTHSEDIRIASTIREQVVIWLWAVYLLMLHEASHFHDSIKNMSSYTRCSKYTQNWRHTRSRSICWRASFCQEDRKGERNGEYPISHTRYSTRTISSFLMHSTFRSCDSVTREPRAYFSCKRIDARSTITKTGQELEGTFSKPTTLDREP